MAWIRMDPTARDRTRGSSPTDEMDRGEFSDGHEFGMGSQG